MIVDSMTHDEVYVELARDRESITKWWKHQKEALRRPVLKNKNFPLIIWKEHISPRKNHYFFYTRIFEKRMRSMLTGISVIRRGENGIYVYTTWLSHQKLIMPMVLMPHMWKRYAERTGLDKTGIDLVKHYFSNNPHGADSNNQKIVGSSVRYNGEKHMTCCVPEGVLLGQNQNQIFIVRTFITYDMCSGLQQRVFEEKRKEILTDRKMYNEAKQFYRSYNE